MTEVSDTVSEKMQPLVQAHDLVKHFPISRTLLPGAKDWIRAVDGISFEIKPRETLALVGESGSGKTTVGRLLLGLISPTKGEIFYSGRDIASHNSSQRKMFRRKVQVVFQDPFSALDPQMKVGAAIDEGLRIHRLMVKPARVERVHELMQQVGLDPNLARRYPHELSGGQRQRVVIARALALSPEFLIADEPVSALDMSIQAQVLNLLQDLQESFGLTYLLISHDISIVDHLADRIAVMYLGEIVEQGTVDQTLGDPRHPYTQMLLDATPDLTALKAKSSPIVMGELPSLIKPPSGCRFHPRCPVAIQGRCSAHRPSTFELEGGHLVACWLFE